MTPPAWLALHGVCKTFVVGVFPYESPLFPDPIGEGAADGRLEAEVRTDRLDVDVHEELTATAGSSVAFGVATGVARGAPEAVDLSFEAADGPGFSVTGRTDRLVATLHLGPVDVALGRQAITFGGSLLFQPMDLVAPFTPTAIDQEFKPGVDAARVDAYAGTSFRATVVAAYGGSWDLPGALLAAYAQGTVGVTDLRAFAGEIHAGEVGGLGFTTAVGPVGLHGDATVTAPDGGDPFVRAAAGGEVRPTGTLTLAAEGYVQTNGARDPAEYLAVASDPHWIRGEQWALGRYYLAATASWEATPLVTPSLAVIANVGDPSALLVPAVAWSVADEATLSAGADLGIGARPDGTEPRSELGTWPATAYVRMAAYF